MALIKGKIIGFSTFRDTYSENFNRPSDIVLSITVPTNTVGKGNVIKIENFPDNSLRNLSDMNGYFIVDDITVATGKAYVYLTTGKSVWKGDTKDYNYPKQADYFIRANAGSVQAVENIAGWQKNAKSVNEFQAQAAGKIDNIRRIYKWLKEEIAPSASILIKESSKLQDFQNIIGDLEDWYWYGEAAYNQWNGLYTTRNPYYKQYNLQKISDIYKRSAGSLKAAESDFLKKEKRVQDWMKVSGFEKMWRGSKKLSLAPLRFIVQIALEYNVKGFGMAAYQLKKQNPAKFEDIKNTWFDLGGTASKLEKFVEKGGTRKAKNNFIGADGENEELTNEYIKIPNGIGTTIAGIVEGILAIPPQSAAAVVALPYTAAGAGVIEGMAALVNNAKIKKPKKQPAETTPDNAADNPPPSEDDSKGLGSLDDIAKNNPLLVWGTVAVVTLGTVGYIFRKKLFKSK